MYGDDELAELVEVTPVNEEEDELENDVKEEEEEEGEGEEVVPV